MSKREAWRTHYEQKLAIVKKNGQFFPWMDLSLPQISKMQKADRATKRSLMDEYLFVSERYLHENGQEEESNKRRRDVFLDLLLSTFVFAEEQQFSPVQISTLISLIQISHLYCCELYDCVPITFQSAFALFERLLLKHSIDRPPLSIAVFSLSEMKVIMQFALRHYFQYMKMYQYMFSCLKRLQLEVFYSEAERVDITPAVIPLSQAISCTTSSILSSSSFSFTSFASSSASLSLPFLSSSSTLSALSSSSSFSAEKELPLSFSTASSSASSSSLSDTLSSSQALFSRPVDEKSLSATLTTEMNKLQIQVSQRLQEQQDSFNKRISQIEEQLKT
eukprot:TRINITY_DN3482_c0_g1_i1.p1 TRINITY_DN3482_c0_g1~~TRINITY_DN3482_c0_g1_i1.p1  ORF type:complete len:349 (+),score=85.53 TRINITY_DN3482_c0_g1_i1:44-1048(+)